MSKQLHGALVARMTELEGEREAIQKLLDSLNGAGPKKRTARAGPETVPVTRMGKAFRRKRAKRRHVSPFNANATWIVKILGTLGPANFEQLCMLAVDKKRGPEHLLRRRGKDVRHTLHSSLAYGVRVTKKWELDSDGKYRLAKKREPKSLGRIGKEVSSGTS